MGPPCSSPDEIFRFRFNAPRIRGRTDGVGDGQGGKEGELRTLSSPSTRTSSGSLGVLDLTVVIAVEVLDPVDRVDFVDLGFVTDLRVDFGFESDVGIAACASGPGPDFGEFICLAGEGSELEPHSSSGDANRVGSFCFTGLTLLRPPRVEPCEPPTSRGLPFNGLPLGLPFFGGVAGS